MADIQQSVQDERILLYCRSHNTDSAAEFVQNTLQQLQTSIESSLCVPFLAFCNLALQTFSVEENSYIDAGYVVQLPASAPDGVFCETKPTARVLSCSVIGEVESRSAIHLELLLYAQVYGMKLENSVYEYYFRIPSGHGESAMQTMTVFTARIQ